MIIFINSQGPSALQNTILQMDFSISYDDIPALVTTGDLSTKKGNTLSSDPSRTIQYESLITAPSNLKKVKDVNSAPILPDISKTHPLFLAFFVHRLLAKFGGASSDAESSSISTVSNLTTQTRSPSYTTNTLYLVPPRRSFLGPWAATMERTIKLAGPTTHLLFEEETSNANDSLRALRDGAGCDLAFFTDKSMVTTLKICVEGESKTSIQKSFNKFVQDLAGTGLFLNEKALGASSNTSILLKEAELTLGDQLAIRNAVKTFLADPSCYKPHPKSIVQDKSLDIITKLVIDQRRLERTLFERGSGTNLTKEKLRVTGTSARSSNHCLGNGLGRGRVSMPNGAFARTNSTRKLSPSEISEAPASAVTPKGPGGDASPAMSFGDYRSTVSAFPEESEDEFERIRKIVNETVYQCHKPHTRRVGMIRSAKKQKPRFSPVRSDAAAAATGKFGASKQGRRPSSGFLGSPANLALNECTALNSSAAQSVHVVSRSRARRNTAGVKPRNIAEEEELEVESENPVGNINIVENDNHMLILQNSTVTLQHPGPTLLTVPSSKQRRKSTGATENRKKGTRKGTSQPKDVQKGRELTCFSINEQKREAGNKRGARQSTCAKRRKDDMKEDLNTQLSTRNIARSGNENIQPPTTEVLNSSENHDGNIRLSGLHMINQKSGNTGKSSADSNDKVLDDDGDVVMRTNSPSLHLNSSPPILPLPTLTHGADIGMGEDQESLDLGIAGKAGSRSLGGIKIAGSSQIGQWELNHLKLKSTKTTTDGQLNSNRNPNVDDLEIVSKSPAIRNKQ